MIVEICNSVENYSDSLDTLDCMNWFNRIVKTLIEEQGKRDTVVMMKGYENTTATKFFKWDFGSSHFWLKQIDEKGELIGDKRLLYVKFSGAYS